MKLTQWFLCSLLMAMFMHVSAQGLHADGKRIADESGKEVILRGMGLGGWMLQEPYMLEMSGIATAQWDIKQKISKLLGPERAAEFYDAWLANHCTRTDIDSLEAWGFNSVRLPMHYNLFALPVENEPVAGQNTWIGKGFALTDSLVKWCRENHMYVILDLHAAPGGQGMDYPISDGDPANERLWENEANKLKTIALWRKLAEHYAGEPWIGAYDIINEPNWSFTKGGNKNGCSEESNVPLRQLLMDITKAIREVDKKHMIIIEGNCWGNNYKGVFPLWDTNMAVSFHKYWSFNDLNTISPALKIREEQNVPVWLGESGENSNAWFTDAIRLVEAHGIGWAWWPLKKVNSIVGPLTITEPVGYKQLLDYWKSGGEAPDGEMAYQTMMQLAENANIRNCIHRKDVIDAMFRQVYDSTAVPFKKHLIPGTINAADYDLGRSEIAYSDSDAAEYWVSNGKYTAWNKGHQYRNDGVDIGKVGQNYFVCYTKKGEWMQYTADVAKTGTYSVRIRYATPKKSCSVKLQSRFSKLDTKISLPATGGNLRWKEIVVSNVQLKAGRQNFKVLFVTGDINLQWIDFQIK